MSLKKEEYLKFSHRLHNRILIALTYELGKKGTTKRKNRSVESLNQHAREGLHPTIVEGSV